VAKTAAWRWGNLPLPQAHLLGLGAGILVQVIASWKLAVARLDRPRLRLAVDPCRSVAGGVGGAGGCRGGPATARPARRWRAVRLQQEPDVGGLDLVDVGIAVAASAAWPLLLPVVLLVTHVVVVGEERCLERQFGAADRCYKTSVGRYL
jgi:hypothetical protein